MKILKSIYGLIISAALLFSSCNKAELTDLNINPNTLNNVDAEYMLAKAQLLNQAHQYAFEQHMYYIPGYIQHFAAIRGVLTFGDKYLNNRPEDMNAMYTALYTNPVVNLTDIIRLTKDDASQAAVYNMARITRVFVMHRITDMYGDIVYSEGGAGYKPGILLPKFDAQKDIYADMLKELEEASNGLKATGNELKKPVQDLFYGGDKTKWVKFANSLMLRLAMRMAKADAAAAKTWVGKAIAGGLMTSNEDNTILKHTDGPSLDSRNPMSLIFEYVETEGQKLSKTLVDFLRNNEDPRLMIISMGIGPATGPFNTNPAQQKGMPNGHDGVTILNYEGLPANSSLDISATYSSHNIKLFARTAPSLFLTYGEVELLLAEAAQLGFIADDAATHYNKGVAAAMKMYAIFDPSYAVSDGAIATYLAAHPYVPANGLKMIGEQYWVANFTNPKEAWANWRRTGFPVLVPVQYPGAVYGDVIPRRFPYPSGEAAVNSANYQAVIARQGPDTWETKMWWDK